MKRSLILDGIIIVLIATLIVILSDSYFDTFFSRFTSARHISKVIMIDAGHGGIDGGAIGSTGSIEKYINLAISKKLKGYLEEQGFTVIMVRETDQGLYYEQGSVRSKYMQGLKRRKEMIKEYNVDMFISIHLNKFAEEKYFGAQVFYIEGDAESQKLANLTQEELKKIDNRSNNRVAKSSGGYYILKGNNIPSIIVECGFLSNNIEEKLLKDEVYQNKLAWSIYSGVVDFYTVK